MRHLIAAILILSFRAVQAGPPREAGPFRAPDLVELTLDPTTRLDIRYATPKSLPGRAVYTEARAFLQRPAADALLRANRALKSAELRAAGRRRLSAPARHELFGDVTPPDKHEFVADPATGSKHNRCCAVDLSMYDLSTRLEVEMPSGNLFLIPARI